MSILVFGSLNIDLVVQATRLPTPGETLLGKHFERIPGGKGANQAVAVARQQVPTAMVGRVGADSFGRDLRQALKQDGVDDESIQTDPHQHTGVAAIAVADTGENHILVVPGANGAVGDADLTQLEARLPTARILLLQLEIPIPAVVEAATRAHKAGITVILDPAPAPPDLPASLYQHTHILTPNQVEAAQLVGFPVDTVAAATEAARRLRQLGCEIVLVKLGGQGVVAAIAEETFHVPAFSVPVVDTVAAGDAFNGGLAVALYEGQSFPDAIAWASATAALSITQSGAQPSLPTRSQVEALLRQTASHG